MGICNGTQPQISGIKKLINANGRGAFGGKDTEIWSEYCFPIFENVDGFKFLIELGTLLQQYGSRFKMVRTALWKMLLSIELSNLKPYLFQQFGHDQGNYVEIDLHAVEENFRDLQF